ncbi:hypothetical protein Hanom_Chr01g00067281 [Helianthus anomalus]
MRFLMKVLRFFRVHICQVNPLRLSRVNHFEISDRALGYKPDLNVFWYLYEFITPETSTPSLTGRDNFFWLDDLCFAINMVWRFKDQSMDFELGENIAFNQNMARDLIDNRSPTHPLPKHIILLSRVSHFCDRGDKEWPVISKKGESK